MISSMSPAFGSFSSQTLISSGDISLKWQIVCHTSSSINGSTPTLGIWPPQPDQKSFISLLDQWSRSSPVFIPFPPLSSFRALDLATRFHLHIDGSRRFGFPDFRNIKSQLSLFPNGFYLELIIHWRVSISDQWLWSLRIFRLRISQFSTLTPPRRIRIVVACPLESNGWFLLRVFTRNPHIYATCPLGLTT